jgi:hypothetical protein
MIKENNGVFSLLSTCNSFENDYTKINIANMILHPSEFKGGVILKTDNIKGYLPVATSLPLFLTIKEIYEGKLSDASVFKVLNSVFSFFENEPVLCFFDQYLPESKTLAGNIIFKKNEDFLCTELSVGDIFCMSIYNNMPLYIRKEILEKNGDEYENACAKFYT